MPALAEIFPRNLTATRDEILASRTGSLDTYRVTNDRGVSYRVLGPVAGDTDRVWAISDATGIVVLVTRSGKVNVPGKGEQVRARFAYPLDTGDAAGTLFYDLAGTVGGLAPRVLFGSVA